jgi:anti-sigma regulatory factor (Ser/Thr protein kinase)
MKIHLPNSAFLGNIDSFLRSIDTSNKDVLEVTFNEHWMSIHPVVLCMVYSLAVSLEKHGGKIKGEPLEAASKHYLERMGLLHVLHMETGHVRTHESSGRFIPLTKITDSDQLGEFITEMVPLLHAPEQAEPIKYVISELVRNVFEHSNSSIGSVVCAQFFKKSKRISVGVVDVGIGITKSISRSHLVNTDKEAIGLALTPGVTGLTNNFGGTESNAGAGLFFIKSIAKINRDFFMLYSGSAMYKLLKTSQTSPAKLYADPLQDRHSFVENLPFWQGTAVGIDISLERNQRFDSLLDLIRDVYRLDIKERKKEKFKQARFI